MDATTLMNKAMSIMKGGKRNSRKTRKARKSRKNMRGGQNASMNAPALNIHKNIPTNNVSGGALRAVGTRAEVMHGTAHHTSGGLTKKDLKYNKRGRIVSRRASEAGRKALRRLTRAGYKARKGKFTLFKRKH